jgi:hypothetical protein
MTAVAFVSALALSSVACAAPFGEDDGAIDSQESALSKKESGSGSGSTSGTGLTLAGSISSTCIDAESAAVRVAAEVMSSGSTDSVVVSIEGSFSDFIELTSSQWSKQKGGNWAFVSSTKTLGNGDHTFYVCATQSGGRTTKQTCAFYTITVACN